MRSKIYSALDARQTTQWGKYLKGIGWEIKKIDKTQIFIRKLPFFNVSFIKIQHAGGPFPFKKIDEFAKKNNTMWTVLEPHIAGYVEEDFIKNGYKKSKMLYAHTATIKIDLEKNTDHLFKSLSENARRNIKKAQKEKLEIRKFFMNDKKNWKYFDVFYDLLKNLGKMKNFYVPSYDEYYKKMTAFQDRSVLLFAYEKKTPIAVVWFACFENVMAYFQTGITKRGYETLANYLLVWEGFKLAKKLKVSIFDFESIYDERFPKNVPRYKNYTQFKKRFHGEIVLYPHPWIKMYTFFGKVLYTCGTLF